MQRMTVNEFKLYCRNIPKIQQVKLKRDKWITYHKLYCGFDIETTTVNEKSFMYIWQFSILSDNMEQIVIKGRTWLEFDSLLKYLKKRFGLREQCRIIIWVANLSYEFQFIRKRMSFDYVFAKTSLNPLIALSGGFEFREALSISQGNLAYLAKTYCTTQKMVGDIDYNIPRNSQTPLTPAEEQYCDNDVIILSEFSKHIFDNYVCKEKYIPMTSTGILRHNLKQSAKQSVDKPEKLYNYIKSLFPTTKADYLYIFNYLFRGGFVHANYTKAGYVLENMVSFDKKSSYPASAFEEYYPVSTFERVQHPSWETLIALCKKYCVIAKITFYNVRSKTPHSIESKSKCIKLVSPLLDNGRVHDCKEMTVLLNELDIANYMDFYEWDKNVDVHLIEIARRGDLPKYLLDSFYSWYYLKETTDKKANKQKYDIIKTRVNGNFGMCVTRLAFSDIVYNEEWGVKESEQTYEEMISEQVLSPFWGIWIASHSRRSELETLAHISEYVAYSDTDSHKCNDTPAVYDFFKSYNQKIEYKNKLACDKFGYDFKILQNIGKFEFECKYTKFKTLGSKRYMVEENGEVESTISGIRKGTLEKYCKEAEKDPFTFFENDMLLPEKYTNKLTPIHLDTPYNEIVTDLHGNSERMYEESGIYLKPVTFTVAMDRDYLKLLLYNIERIRKHG